MSFQYPWWLILLPLCFIPFWLKSRQGHLYSWITILPEDSLSRLMDKGLKGLMTLLLLSILLALAHPHGPEKVVQRIGKGAQTVMVIDRSVSMDHPFAGDVTSGSAAEIKSTAARRLITKFIDSRPDDMMGVVGFSNSALYGIKITNNRDAIHAAINAATSPSINQTNIGSGLTRAVTLFDNIDSTGSRAIILLSDGAGKLSPRVKATLQTTLKKNNLALYWIVLRQPDDVSIFSKNVYDEDRVPTAVALDRYFQSLNIKYHAYEADNPATLQSAIQDIGSRENKTIQYPITIPGRNFSKDLALLALIFGTLILLFKNLRVYSWKNT
ncbi:VWA domain-containing protein [Methylobacillus gramineus]|uniref:vWA domain-containing protein n=1 Tax=Methylobacillus gramineus TaxID=755169 RepID=UPI001CFF85AF|nr:vWA domain-containing protein [Methylobacillus gramineus]MCB5184922.1 VWA domain-containing protein [Methylobacillus gramineus]